MWYIRILKVTNDNCFQFLFSLIDSGNRWQYDSKAFLFSLVNKPGWAPVKLPQTGKYSSSKASLFFYSSYGPTFGGGYDIYLSNYASSNINSYSRLGHTYGPPLEDTATTAISPTHSWQDHTTSDQTKQKHFTKQPKLIQIMNRSAVLLQ